LVQNVTALDNEEGEQHMLNCFLTASTSIGCAVRIA
jgi:hypothetical protein